MWSTCWHFENSSERRKCKSNLIPDNDNCINREKYKMSLILDWTGGSDQALCWHMGDPQSRFSNPDMFCLVCIYELGLASWTRTSSHEPSKPCSYTAWMDGLPNAKKPHIVSRAAKETPPEHKEGHPRGEQLTNLQGIKVFQWKKLSGGLQEC